MILSQRFLICFFSWERGKETFIEFGHKFLTDRNNSVIVKLFFSLNFCCLSPLLCFYPLWHTCCSVLLALLKLKLSAVPLRWAWGNCRPPPKLCFFHQTFARPPHLTKGRNNLRLFLGFLFSPVEGPKEVQFLHLESKTFISYSLIYTFLRKIPLEDALSLARVDCSFKLTV